jgi:poly(A)-specific ribonuclease
MSRSLTIVPEEHEEFVNEVIKKVDSFLEDASSSQLELEPCNSFMRKLVYEALSGSKYRNRLDVSTKNVSPSSRDSFLLISKSSVETKEKTLRDLVTEASGVSRILQFISQSKKPIVGHNVFLDIIHIVGQFMTSNLPDSYQEYKELVHSLFPEIYDTKFISSTAAFKNLITSSTLEDLIKQLSQDPFNTVVFTSERSVPEPGNRYHEAGYDADVTGQCFIFMNNYLQEKFDVKFREESSAIGPEIKRFVNRIHLTFSFDLDHYHFGGPEVNLPRDQVFYISFTEETTQQRLNELMSPFGYFQYQWLGDSSMLVGFKDHAKASFFRKAFKADLDVSAVKSYADFKKISREESDKRNSHASYKRRIQSLTPGLKRVRVDGTSSSTPANPEEETPTTNLSSRNMTTYFEEVADW